MAGAPTRLHRVGRALAVPGLMFVGGCASLPVANERQTPAGTVSLVAIDEAEATRAIGLYRESHGLGSVSLNPDLDAVARHQAEAMAHADLLSHEIAGDLAVRIKAAGLQRAAEAENVSAGYPSFARALLGWEHSPRHNENLLYRPLRRVGIAAAAAPGTRFKTFWALVMTD